LFVSCINKRESKVKCLIKFGTDINKKDKDDETPLFITWESENKNIIKDLIEHRDRYK